MAFWEADSRHAGELSVFYFAKKPIHNCQLVDKKFKKPSKATLAPSSLNSVEKVIDWVMVTPETQWVLLFFLLLCKVLGASQGF